MWHLAIHWVASSLNPAVGGIFFLSLSHFLFQLIALLLATVGSVMCKSLVPVC